VIRRASGLVCGSAPANSLAAVGPRAGYYGTASPLYDVLSLLILLGLIVFVLDLLGVIEVFGIGA
jgi:hypothetical protein